MSNATLERPRTEATGRTRPKRACDRCGHVRVVRDPDAPLNLCSDCKFVMTAAEIEKWAA